MLAVVAMSCSIVFFSHRLYSTSKANSNFKAINIKRAEICARLGFYVSQNGIPYRCYGTTFWTLEVGNVPEENVSPLYGGGSLKSRII